MNTVTYRLRVRDDAHGYGNYCVKHRGKRMGRSFDTREEAEEAREVGAALIGWAVRKERDK